MFSLDEARLLDLRANETNFNSVVQILTGIPLDTNQQNDIVSLFLSEKVWYLGWKFDIDIIFRWILKQDMKDKARMKNQLWWDLEAIVEVVKYKMHFSSTFQLFLSKSYFEKDPQE